MSEDPLAFVKDALAEVEREGKKSVADRIYVTWSEHYSNWIDFFQPLLKGLNDFEKFNLIIVFRLTELQNILIWIWMNTIWGRYHTAIREMRYLLDALIQANYLDTEHPEADIRCKLEILKEIEGEAFGSRLIDKTRLDHRHEVKRLYSELSKYVHSSYEELEPVIKRGRVDWRVTFAFDRELFDRCERLTDNIMDAVYYVTLKQFPRLKETVKSNRIMMDSLEKSECRMTLSQLKATEDAERIQ